VKKCRKTNLYPIAAMWTISSSPMKNTLSAAVKTALFLFTGGTFSYIIQAILKESGLL